jgi:putative redox protein
MNSVSVQLTRTGQTATTTDIRGHVLTFDRPESNDGHNQGPMGGEAFLASIGGCFMSTLIAAANARGVKVDDARCEVTGTISDGPRRYRSVDITAHAGSCPAEDFRHLVLLAERGCLVLNTLRGDLSLTVAVAPG